MVTRILFALVVLLAPVVASHPAHAATALPLDLPWITLDRAQVSAVVGDPLAGEAWGIEPGTFLSMEDDVQFLRLDRGADPDLTRATLADAGWRQHFQQTWAWVDAPTLEWGLSLTIYAVEFGSAAGAASGMAVMQDETGPPGYPALAEDVPGSRTFGDGSEVTYLAGEGYTGYDLTFRIGPVMAGITLLDFEGTGRATIERTEALATALQANVESVISGESPGFPALTVPLDRPAGLATTDLPGFTYLVRDGEAAYDWSWDEDTRAAMRAYYGMASDVSRSVTPVGDAAIAIDLLRLSSPEEAAAHVEVAGIALGLMHDAAGTPAEAMPAPAIGDAAVLQGDATGQELLVASDGWMIRVGLLGIPAGMAVDPAALTAIAQAQLDCLAAGGCDGPVAVPAGLLQPAA